MFSMLAQVEDGPGTRIAWMTGFVWQKNTIIDYEKFSQHWFSNEPSIIGKILPVLQKSRKFAEHRFVDTARFILDFIQVVLIIKSILEFLYIVDDKQSNTSDIVIFLLLIIMIVAIPFLQKLTAWRLKQKIKGLLEELNQQWNAKGIRISFPKMTYKFCLFIKCCKCFDDTNYNTIQIWQFEPIAM